MMNMMKAREVSLLLALSAAACRFDPVVGGSSDAMTGDGSADAAPDAIRGTGAILGRVRVAGAAEGLANVTVLRPGGSSAVTDAHGWFVFSAVPEDPRATVRVDHPGYAEAVKPVAVEAGAVSEVEVVVARFTATVQIDAQTGGTIDDGAGGVAVIPPDALVTADGRLARGMVTVSIAPLDPSASAQMDAFPGDFTAARSDGSAADLETFVPMQVSAKQGSATLDLAAGSSAELSLPVPAAATGRAPETIELWRLDPAAGRWQEEGTAQRSPMPGRPGAAVYRARARRLGWWNCDRPTQTTCVRGCVRSPEGAPFPRAQVRSEGVDYFGRSAAVTSPATGCFALDVKRSALVAITVSSGGLSAPRRELTSGDVVMRARAAPDRCQDLGTIVLAAPVPSACATGMSLCGERCVSLARDTANCGACGAACGGGQTCIAGACGCPESQTRCGDRCVDTRNDTSHCGACGSACAVGVRCASGVCSVMDAGVDAPPDAPRDAGVDLPVDAPRDADADVAVDLPRDTGPTCAPGMLFCVADCVDPRASASHCGACGNACPGGASAVPACAAGRCGLQCNAGFADCDGLTANGCEVTLATDASHCGACRSACAPPTGGGASCALGVCRSTCPTGRAACGGACVDTQVDAAHCGACDSPCATGRTCVAGACAVPEVPFRVLSLGAGECAVSEHSMLSGSSQGGLAIAGEDLLHAGSTGTARFDLRVSRGTLNATRFPALVGTASHQAFTFATGSTPLGAAGGVADGIVPINYGGALDVARRVALSTPLAVTPGTGFFAGYNRVVLHVGGRVQDIDVSTGRVTDRGALALPTHPTCGALGYWGVAESYGGQLYLDLIQSRTAVGRVRVSDGAVTTLATFADLGSSCAFFVSQSQGWFIATDGPSDFAPAASVGASHVVACGARTDQPTVFAGDGVTAGQAFSCAIRPDQSVACWGINTGSQLGDGTSVTQRTTPAAVSLSSAAASVAAGVSHACALQSDGRVACWGTNASGQIGNGTTTLARWPATPGSITDAVEVAVGGFHTCARRTTGAVLCWGDNALGQLGDGTTTTRLVPTPVSGLTDAVALAAGATHTCAVRSRGALVCWGNNAQGRLGDGTTANRLVPTAVPGLSEVAEVTAGLDFTCARWGGGFVSCWGNNGVGQLGDGTTTAHGAPARVGALMNVQSIDAGGQHVCVRTSTSQAQCWGGNTAGQLGDGTATSRASPVNVTGLTGVSEVSAGADHTCARLATGATACWGANANGQLGDGTTTSRNTPPLP